jgi:hypothetical protein
MFQALDQPDGGIVSIDVTGKGSSKVLILTHSPCLLLLLSGVFIYHMM